LQKYTDIFQSKRNYWKQVWLWWPLTF